MLTLLARLTRLTIGRLLRERLGRPNAYSSLQVGRSGEGQDYKLLRAAVERVLRSLGRVYAAILFGSGARGDWLPWSDYDLLVIADFDKPYLERIKMLLDLLADIPLPTEPHPYTLEGPSRCCVGATSQ
jgi:predicted nucleotidyltransferase